MKKSVSYLLNLNEQMVDGINQLEIVNGKQTGKFVKVSAFEHFFDNLYNNHISKLNGKERNIQILEDYDDNAILFIKNEFRKKYNIDLQI